MAESILVVDDDEEIVLYCEMALRAAGFQTTKCYGGEEALRLIEAKPFDLVLTDMQMPGAVDGHGVVKAVRVSRPGLPVLIMTAAPTLETAIAALKEGAYDYIIKPVTGDSLLAAIRRCLDHQKLRQDLAGERAMRQELEAAYQELQKVEELKEAVVSRLSHEIRTPMTEFIMALSAAEQDAGSLPNIPKKDSIIKMLEAAKRGADRLQAKMADLLAFSDLQKDSRIKNLRPVDMRAVCEQVVARLGPAAQARDIKISLEFAASIKPVMGDQELLMQAVTHLLNNAILFNRNGGSVAITGKTANGALRLSFSDTGEGIPESELSKVFDSFYQVANFYTRKVGGVGLGLSLVRRIVEAHGGKVTVASKLKEGTTFSVTLP